MTLKDKIKDFFLNDENISIMLLSAIGLPLLIAFLKSENYIEYGAFFEAMYNKTLITHISCFIFLLFIITKVRISKSLCVFLYPITVYILAMIMGFIFYLSIDGKYPIALLSDTFLIPLTLNYALIIVLSIPTGIFAYADSANKMAKAKSLEDKKTYKRIKFMLIMVLIYNLIALFIHHENVYNSQVYAIFFVMFLYLLFYFYYIFLAFKKGTVTTDIIYISLLLLAITIIENARIYNLTIEEENIYYSFMLSISTLFGYTPASSDIKMDSLEHIILQLQRFLMVLISSIIGITVGLIINRKIEKS